MGESVKHLSQRVGVFVDASNMYFSAQRLYNGSLNFKSVLNTAVAKRNLVRAFAYVVTNENEGEKEFLQALDDIGFEVRSKPLQVFSSGTKKGDWDVGLAMDVVRSLPLIDVVVLVSGDGDYVDLLDYCRGHGRRTEVMAFKQTTSNKLLEETDEFTDFSADTRKYIFSKRPRTKITLS